MVQDLYEQINCCIILILLLYYSKLYRYEVTNYDKIICLALNIIDITIIRKTYFLKISSKLDGSACSVTRLF